MRFARSVLPVFLLLAAVPARAQYRLYNTSLIDSTLCIAYIGHMSQFTISGIKASDQVEIHTGQGLIKPNDRHPGKFGYYCQRVVPNDTLRIYKNKKLILKVGIELRTVPVPVFYIGNFTDTVINLPQLKENNIIRAELPGCLLKTAFTVIKFQLLTFTADGDLLTESDVIEGNSIYGQHMDAIQSLAPGETFMIQKLVVNCPDCVMPSILPSKQFFIK